MSRTTIMLVALLTPACSGLLGLNDLQYHDDAGADADGDTDADTDADGDTDTDTDGDTDSDADTDTDIDTDSDTDTDSDADGGTDTDTETETEIPSCADAGNWYDDTTGLCWQSPSPTDPVTWDAATAYCESLSLAGHDDWHLPTIDEARSLVRGCPGTVTGGACAVTSGCLLAACWSVNCSNCGAGGGPDDGCYWPAEIEGECIWYWTSSGTSDVSTEAWCIAFNAGSVGSWGKSNSTSMRARCVRTGE